MTPNVLNPPLRSTSVHVPSDIILEVIDNLDSSKEKQTLAALCLISSSIRPAAQRRLFSSVHFTYLAVRNLIEGILPLDKDEETSSFIFLRTITEHPDLAQYVKHFHFKLNFMHNQRINHLDVKSSWKAIVPRLTSLHGFHWEETLTDPWSTYNPIMASIIEKALTSTTIKTITLRSVAFVPPSLITHCPNLKSLDITLVKAPTEEEQYGQGPVYLDTLVIGTRAYSAGLGQFVELFNPCSAKALSLSRLTSLAVPTDYLDVMDISTILSFCSSSLTDLDLMVPRTAVYRCIPVEAPAPVSQVCPIVNLGSLVHLKRLSISGRIKAKWLNSWRLELANSPLPWIAHVLDTLPANYGSDCRHDSQIWLQFDIEDLSIPSLEALPWKDVVQSLLQQKHNFHDTRIDFKCYYFTYDNTLNAVPSDIPTKPTLIPERIDVLARNAELQKLGQSVKYDRTERHDFRLTGY